MATTTISRSSKIKKDWLFDLPVNLVLVLVVLVILVPLWFVLVVSLTPLSQSQTGYNFFLSPTNWSFEAYRQLLTDNAFVRALVNSLIITVMGVTINIVFTVLTAYALSVKTLPGRNIFMILILFTFLFNVGLVPNYLLVKNLGLIDNYLAVILPGAISVYNLFVMKTFFQNIPEGLKEAATIDGASQFQVLWRIVLPLSVPILLTIGLFYGVTHWNEFFLPILYFNNQDMQPLPVLLRNILTAANMNEYVDYNAVASAPQQALKMAAVLLTMIPMLIVYPWIQKHFTKGVLVGGIKE
ncbi:MAG: carbohydrate ABC transporter permease [Chloroflexi bacterium]|nr:carbohydrate ABC transporter permease [Chloroflexota bacterium]OJV92819.1 MAG: ABC transporter permease [Chloroflexi bacterium 54-19]